MNTSLSTEKNILVFLFIFSFVLISGQSINFKKYGIDEGINHPTIYTINQDAEGFIWLGTGAGVSFFDGQKFSPALLKESLFDAYPNVSYKDINGKIWFGFNDGSVAQTQGRKLTVLYKDTINPSVINTITSYDNNTVLAGSQNAGIIVFQNQKFSKIITEGLNKLVYSIYALNDKLLIGSSNGLYLYNISLKDNKLEQKSKIEGIPSSKVTCIVASAIKGEYWIGTDDAGFFKATIDIDKNIFIIDNVGEKFGLEEANIQNILEDKSGNLWIGTFGAGVYKIAFSKQTNTYNLLQTHNLGNGLTDDFIKVAFEDIEGNIWIGTYSNGLAAIVDEAFSFYNFKNEGISSDILSIAVEKDKIWMGGRNVLIKKTINGSDIQIVNEKNGLPTDAIISLLVDGETLWIGTEKKGIYKMDIKTLKISKFYYSLNSLENKINKLAIWKDNLWVATNGGVVNFNLKTKSETHYSTDNGGLPHNKINSLIVDKTGSVWIATKSTSIFSINSEKKYKIANAVDLEFTSLAFDKNGYLFAATYGDGIFHFDKNDSLNYYSEVNGLKSNYCYSLIPDNDGNIWVGHRLALSKILVGKKKIINYGNEIGIKGDCNFNSVAADGNGTLRFGTSDGIIQYNYLKSSGSLIPPMTNIISVKINDEEIDFSKPIVLPYGKYRIKIDFIGLNYKSPNTVKYQYLLEGWESQWSEVTSNTSVFYPRVEDGNFEFVLKAYNAEGVSQTIPLRMSIKIEAPLWKRWWFITLLVLLISYAVYWYIQYRERKQIEFQQYLQKLLDERTREVMEQKEEIEIKNRDITDSITYAQKIQNSILPSVRKIQENFSGCFILYQPRDIVSGDFYWFDRVSDDKFMIVCADSTGHGVPGALMSMIGTTLIKDICNRPDVVSPLNVLQKLDEEMIRTLNQNFEAEKSSDGMDLIVCEINTTTNVVKIASAMRPVIIYQNHQEVYIAGSKNSIGGETYMNQAKEFEELSYQLSKGDIIYMFSDGFPDQFGGPMGKKFKMTRMRNLIKDVSQLPMEEQYNYIRNSFNIWKNNYEQVDDVLFMGIKI